MDKLGTFSNHVPIATTVDIDILRICLNDQWLPMALTADFTRVGNNSTIILVNDAQKSSNINP